MIHPMLIYMVFVLGVLISVVLTKCCYLWNRYTDAAYLNWQKKSNYGFWYNDNAIYYICLVWYNCNVGHGLTMIVGIGIMIFSIC